MRAASTCTSRSSAPRGALFALLLTVAAALAVAEPVDNGVRVTVSGARFQFLAADGSELPVARTIGARLTVRIDDGSERRIRIDAAEPDPRDRRGEVVLYDFSVFDEGSGEWRPYCEPDPEGRRTGFPLAAGQMGGGTRAGGFFVTCTGGAYGKCIRFGYRPWQDEEGGDLYRSCVRLVRADYCGDGVGHTRNGTPINIYDPKGIQLRDEVPGMRFEAGWGPDGAVCVDKTRLPQEYPLERLLAECPRLRAATDAGVCDGETALRRGARILNESY